jgi:hypothetical protein
MGRKKRTRYRYKMYVRVLIYYTVIRVTLLWGIDTVVIVPSYTMYTLKAEEDGVWNYGLAIDGDQPGRVGRGASLEWGEQRN